MKWLLIALVFALPLMTRAQAPDSIIRAVYTERGLADLSNQASPPYVATAILKADGTYLRAIANRVTETGSWTYRKVAADRAELILNGEWHVLIFRTTESGTWLDARGGSEASNSFSLVAAPAGGRVANVSHRVALRNGEVAVTGFVIADQPMVVLVRGVGPGLRSFGVADAADRMRLRVHASTSDTPIAENNKWGDQGDSRGAVEIVSTLGSALGAFPLANSSNDTAAALLLAPGAYTVELSPADQTPAGVALMEIYFAP